MTTRGFGLDVIFLLINTHLAWVLMLLVLRSMVSYVCMNQTVARVSSCVSYGQETNLGKLWEIANLSGGSNKLSVV